MGILTNALITTKEGWIRAHGNMSTIHSKCVAINNELKTYGNHEEVISSPPTGRASQVDEALILAIELEFTKAGWTVQIHRFPGHVKIKIS